MRSRLPISQTTLRTNMADLVSSFVLANEMLVNAVLGIGILYDASDPGAVFDSRDDYDHRCYPGTREQYISDITNWVTESANLPSSMYWMSGPASVGKSAIAQTCAEKLKETGHLGTAFFFTVNKRSNPLRFFAFIAYQLTTALPDYRAAVDDRISKDKSLVEKKMPSQFGSLIVEPIQELQKQGKRIQAKAIFIDGLDECASKDAQAEIIEIIASSVRERSTPFHLAIFSRAEPRIDLTRPYYDQGRRFHLDGSIIAHVLGVHGTFRFYHKSFDDFLRDPTRSRAFCVDTPAFRSKLLNRLIQNHHHYASSYAIDGSSTYFLCCIYPKLTYYSRPRVGTGYHQLLYRTLLATWNRVC